MRVPLFAVALICACAPLQAHSSSDSSVSSSVAEDSPATCGADQFQCSSGPCLHARFRCNSFVDCADGSDELGCPPPTPPPPSACRGDQFQCWDLACVPEASRCDGINDCSDLSDEYYCPPMECRSDQFRCSSGQCIAAEGRCNSFGDCPVYSDEIDCTPKKYKSTERTTPRAIESSPLVPSITSTSTAKSVLELFGASIFRPPATVARLPAPTGDRVLVDLPSWLVVDQDAQFSLSLAAMLRQRRPRDKLALQIDILRLFKSSFALQ